MSLSLSSAISLSFSCCRGEYKQGHLRVKLSHLLNRTNLKLTDLSLQCPILGVFSLSFLQCCTVKSNNLMLWCLKRKDTFSKHSRQPVFILSKFRMNKKKQNIIVDNQCLYFLNLDWIRKSKISWISLLSSLRRLLRKYVPGLLCECEGCCVSGGKGCCVSVCVCV